MPVGMFSHNHEQDVAAAEWNITHNLNTLAPVVDVFIDYEGAVQKIIPASVQVIDAATVKVTFTEARSGTAAIR